MRRFTRLLQAHMIAIYWPSPICLPYTIDFGMNQIHCLTYTYLSAKFLVDL